MSYSLPCGCNGSHVCPEEDRLYSDYNAAYVRFQAVNRRHDRRFWEPEPEAAGWNTGKQSSATRRTLSKETEMLSQKFTHNYKGYWSEGGECEVEVHTFGAGRPRWSS